MGREYLDNRSWYVRVTGIRRAKFVEFDFTVGDPNLTVGLVMPFDAFEEFCKLNGVEELPADKAAEVDFEKLKWRYGVGGRATAGRG